MKTRWYVCLIAACGLTALYAETISGTIFDPSGAVVPNVTVTVSNAESKTSQVMASGPDGGFQVSGLAPGKYRLDFEAPGFRMLREYVTLNTGAARRIAPILQIGRVTETITVRGTGIPAFAAPARIRVGGHVEPPKLLRAPKVAYPETAKVKGATGSVLLRAVILMDGTLSSPAVVRSPDPDLTQAALGAVKQWTYAPTKLNGQPVETETLVEVIFELGQ